MDIANPCSMSIPTIRFNETDYVSIRDIKQHYPTKCDRFRGLEKLTKALRFTNYVMVNITKRGIVPTDKLVGSKTKTILIPAEQMRRMEDHAPASAVSQPSIASAEPMPLPPIIDDDDLQFKDVDGTVLEITMRGERTPQGIFFSVEDIEAAFAMPRLHEYLLRDDCGYTIQAHYRKFDKSSAPPAVTRFPALYLTFAGLQHLVSTSSNQVAKRFGEWMRDIVFAAWFGTTEQRVQVSAKILNVDAEHLTAVMGKCANPIACVYLIDIKRESDGRRVYKYGRTNNVRRRFREHITTYGADIELVKFGLIPVSSCVQAENDLRNFVKGFAYQGNEDLADKVELIQLNDEELELTGAEILRIANAFGGDMRDQLSLYEKQITDLKHKHQLEIKDLQHQLDLRDRDIELAEYKHQAELAEARHQLELKDKDIALLHMQLELARLKAAQR